ncbi:MAG: glycosyltransferase [Natronomonas sp.]
MARVTTESTSIIVPVYNDPDGIRDTLDSILDHTDDRPEIIVVDNGSTDHTPAVVRSYVEEYPHVRLEHERAVQGSYAARNTGLEVASGDVVVFLDADQTVTDSWLETGLEALEARSGAYLAPDVRLSSPETPTLAGRYNRATGFPIEEFIERHGFAPTACLFVTRELIDDVGSFDERLVSGGDREFGNRVRSAGYDLHYAPEVVVYHPTRDSLRSLISRNLRIGRGHCQLQRYYPDRYGRVGIPPRPSGIHRDQLEVGRGSASSVADRFTGVERALVSLLGIGMTAVRGVGYYREALAVARGRVRRTVRQVRSEER